MKNLPALLIIIFLQLVFAAWSVAQETRALWVTRWDYTTPEDVRRIVQNAADHNFNVILFQVRGDGTVMYPSKIEPWSRRFYHQDPGWDPLKLAVELAHLNDIELHAWLNVYPAWSGSTPPPDSNQLFLKHPEWLLVDRFNSRQHLNNHYVFLSPTIPEVSDYLLKICREIYINYNVDGLHLDYIRFPANQYSYDEKSLELFKKTFNEEPEKMPRAWNYFRSAAITGFVARLYEEMKRYDPDLVLSASVIGDYFKGKQLYLQDSHEWLSRGIIDAVYPMIYTSDDTHFRRLLRNHRYNDHGRYVYAGIDHLRDKIPQQVAISRELGCRGFALFSYGTLFPGHSDRLFRQSGLDTVMAFPVEPAPHEWKRLVRDNQGPHVVEVQTIPVKVFSDKKFKIAAKVVDPSGVYDDKTGSDGQGMYLIYGKDWPFGEGTEVKMSPLRGNKDWYITDEFIPPLKTGLDFRCRIFAWDNYHESEKHPRRNLGYSDIWSLSILLPAEGYVSAGYLDPIIRDATVMEVDGQGKIWVAGGTGRQLYVFTPQGDSTAYSPITSGLSGEREPTELGAISGMAFYPPRTMYVSVASDSTIYRFDSRTGEPMPGIETGFAPGELDLDDRENLYVLEVGTTRWHLLTATGLELQGSPYGSRMLGNDIAVFRNGGMVFISDQSANRVQVWRGAVEDLRSAYWRASDLPDGDIGFGKVAVDSSNYIYVAHSQRGIITIFDQAREPIGHLTGGFPMLYAPREIAVSPTSDTLYVLEETGGGPVQVSLWIKTPAAD